MIDNQYLPQDNVDKDLLLKCFSNAIEDTVGTMAGFDMIDSGEDLNESRIDGSQITGVMMLQGQRNYMVCASMSMETASVLVSYITGVPYFELGNDEVYDGIAELVNIISGRTKALLSDTEYHFQLTSPFTIVGENYFIIHKSKVMKLIRKFRAGDMDIILKLFIL